MGAGSSIQDAIAAELLRPGADRAAFESLHKQAWKLRSEGVPEEAIVARLRGSAPAPAALPASIALGGLPASPNPAAAPALAAPKDPSPRPDPPPPPPSATPTKPAAAATPATPATADDPFADPLSDAALAAYRASRPALMEKLKQGGALTLEPRAGASGLMNQVSSRGVVLPSRLRACVALRRRAAPRRRRTVAWSLSPSHRVASPPRPTTHPPPLPTHSPPPFQGATCYLNSLLQALYFTPDFRAVSTWPPLRSSRPHRLLTRRPAPPCRLPLCFA